MPAHPKAPTTRPAAAPAPVSGPDPNLRGEHRIWHQLDQRQSCGRHCTYTKTGRSTLTLNLGDNGQAALTGKGQLIEALDASVEPGAHFTEWTTSYKGDWSEGQGALKLHLDREQGSCRRTTASGEISELPDEQPPCGPQKLTLRCERNGVKLKRPKNHRAAAWICSSARPGVVHPIPFPWLFTHGAPLRVHDIIRRDDSTRRILAKSNDDWD